MKKLILLATIFSSLAVGAQVGIGTNNPHTSAQLEVSSTNKGALMPRMTENQRLAIATPAQGLLVFQTDARAGFYYYTGSAWTQLQSGATTRSTPAGTIVAFTGTNVPEGWALCSGAAVSRTEYAELFAAIGATYGMGDGSTTFNLPDLRGRTIFGKDNMGGTAANVLTTTISGTTLGATGGSEKVTLTTSNLPNHNHTFTGTSVNTSSTSHSHYYNDAYYAENFSGGVGGNSRFGSAVGTDNDNNFYWRTSSNGHSTSPQSISTSTESHSHTATANGTIGNTGSGTAFSVVNPAMILNYIIKL